MDIQGDSKKGDSAEEAANPVTPDGKGGQREIQLTDGHCLEPVRPLLLLRSMHTCPALDLTRNHPARVFIRDVAGGLYTIITIDEFASARAADVWPALNAIRQHGDARRNILYVKFVQSFEFLFAATRRVSKEQNDHKYTLTNDPTRGEYIYTPMLELCFITTIPNKSSANKKNIAETVAKVRHISGSIDFILLQHPHSFFLQFLTNFHKPAEVDEHYDLTDHGKQSLDHYLTDATIIRLLESTWRGPVSSDFYKEMGSKIRNIQDPIFSRPYPLVASHMLGYPRDRGWSSLIHKFENGAANNMVSAYTEKYISKGNTNK